MPKLLGVAVVLLRPMPTSLRCHSDRRRGIARRFYCRCTAPYMFLNPQRPQAFHGCSCEAGWFGWLAVSTFLRFFWRGWGCWWCWHRAFMRDGSAVLVMFHANGGSTRTARRPCSGRCASPPCDGEDVGRICYPMNFCLLVRHRGLPRVRHAAVLAAVFPASAMPPTIIHNLFSLPSRSRW